MATTEDNDRIIVHFNPSSDVLDFVVVGDKEGILLDGPAHTETYDAITSAQFSLLMRLFREYCERIEETPFNVLCVMAENTPGLEGGRLLYEEPEPVEPADVFFNYFKHATRNYPQYRVALLESFAAIPPVDRGSALVKAMLWGLSHVPDSLPDREYDKLLARIGYDLSTPRSSTSRR